MSYIKQTALFPGPFMTFAKTQVGVLKWHRVPTKRDHLSTFGYVKIIEAGAANIARIIAARGISIARRFIKRDELSG